MLAGAILGARKGALSVLLLLALVAAGLPLLSGGRGGIAVFVGPSAGYLVGWVLGAFVVGWLTARLLPRYRVLPALAATALGGIVVVYLVGVPVFAANMDLPLEAAIAGSAIFLPGDILKVVVTVLVAKGVHRAWPGLIAPAAWPWRRAGRPPEHERVAARHRGPGRPGVRRRRRALRRARPRGRRSGTPGGVGPGRMPHRHRSRRPRSDRARVPGARPPGRRRARPGGGRAPRRRPSEGDRARADDLGLDRSRRRGASRRGAHERLVARVGRPARRPRVARRRRPRRGHRAVARLDAPVRRAARAVARRDGDRSCRGRDRGARHPHAPRAARRRLGTRRPPRSSRVPRWARPSARASRNAASGSPSTTARPSCRSCSPERVERSRRSQESRSSCARAARRRALGAVAVPRARHRRRCRRRRRGRDAA